MPTHTHTHTHTCTARLFPPESDSTARTQSLTCSTELVCDEGRGGVCVSVRACVHVCVCVCMHTCVRAYVCVHRR